MLICVLDKNAQFELANRGKKSLKVFTKTLKIKRTRLHAIWGISQLARNDISSACVLVP